MGYGRAFLLQQLSFLPRSRYVESRCSFAWLATALSTPRTSLPPWNAGHTLAPLSLHHRFGELPLPSPFLRSLHSPSASFHPSSILHSLPSPSTRTASLGSHKGGEGQGHAVKGDISLLFRSLLQDSRSGGFVQPDSPCPRIRQTKKAGVEKLPVRVFFDLGHPQPHTRSCRQKTRTRMRH